MTIKKEVKRFRNFMLSEMSGNNFDYFIRQLKSEDDIRSFVVQLLNNSKYKFEYEYEVCPGIQHFGKGDIIIWLKSNICMIMEIKFFNKKRRHALKKGHSSDRATKLIKQTKYYSACCKINNPSVHVLGYCLFNYEREDTIGLEFIEILNNISHNHACKLLKESKCGELFLEKHNIKINKPVNRNKNMKSIREIPHNNENNNSNHASQFIDSTPNVSIKYIGDKSDEEDDNTMYDNTMYENIIIVTVDFICILSIIYLVLVASYLLLTYL